MFKTPKNFKTAYIEASKDYFGAIQSTTFEQQVQAMVDNDSAYPDLQGYLLDLDYSDLYEDGTKYEDTREPFTTRYKQWIKDWGLPEPNGKPMPDFYYEDHM